MDIEERLIDKMNVAMRNQKLIPFLSPFCSPLPMNIPAPSLIHGIWEKIDEGIYQGKVNTILSLSKERKLHLSPSGEILVPLIDETSIGRNDFTYFGILNSTKIWTHVGTNETLYRLIKPLDFSELPVVSVKTKMTSFSNYSFSHDQMKRLFGRWNEDEDDEED